MTNLRSSLMTTLGQQQERNISYCTKLFSHFWSIVAFDHWRTHWYTRVLRRVCLMTGMQACQREFALSRRAQGRERFLVLLHLFALLQWPLSPLWGSWIFEGFPVRLSWKLFCSAWTLMLWNLPRVLSPLVFSKRTPALPELRYGSRTWSCPLL